MSTTTHLLTTLTLAAFAAGCGSDLVLVPVPIPGPPGEVGPPGPEGPEGPPASGPTTPDCAPLDLPPGLGGPADARLDAETAQLWKDFRRAREQERLLEAHRPALVHARYRIEQSAIDDGCIPFDALVDIGRGLFMRSFTLDEGFGNDLAEVEGTLAGDRARPNLRRFQRATEARGNFGGPDTNTCISCHWKGGFAGGGDRADNTLFLGDGNDIFTHDARNPPALWGVGWAQVVGQEMTADLAAQRAEARDRALADNEAVTVNLASKGVYFGQLTVAPNGDGTVSEDTSAVEGVDADLRIKPFGYKGVWRDLRAFLLGSTHFHMNLQAEELLAGVADGSIAEVDVGNGPADDDPDNDGVTRELTEGQITAMEAFLATLDAPQIRIPPEPEFAARWAEGAELFDGLGCAYCHVPLMPVEDPTFRSRTALSGAEIAIDLDAKGATPHPEADATGTYWVPVFSDFKRHQMGAYLAGANTERGVSPGTYMTRRLWGLYNTSPYMHDASAVLFDEAIAMHGGEGSEAAGAASAFLALSEDDRASVRVFLLSLAKAPSIRVR
jgi:hypothetical protein